VALFESIKPLFLNKPLIVAVNKVDVRRVEDLTAAEQALLQQMTDAGATVTFMSTFTEEGINDTKATCCDLLLAQRVEHKVQGKKVEQVINRIRVSEPTMRAGGKPRATSVPASVLEKRAAQASRPAERSRMEAKRNSTDLPDADASGPRTQKDKQEDMGGAGVYSLPLQAHWELKRPEWLDDMIPEIMDGKNIADYVDPDIEQRLEELEAEEEERAQLAELEQGDVEIDDEGTSAVRQLASRIRKKKGVVKATAWTKRANNHSRMKGSVDAKKRSVGQFVKHLNGMGIKADASAMPNLKTRTLPGAPGPRMIVRGRGDDERGERAGGGRASRSASADAPMGGDGSEEGVVRMRSSSVPRDRSMTRRDSASIARSQSPARVGLRDPKMIKKADKMAKKSTFQGISKQGRASESDRRIPCKMPKHLFSGKRGNGKTDRR